MYYNGTMLDDSRLLFITIIMTVILIVTIAAFAAYFIFIRNISTNSEKKEAKRIKRLEKDVQENPELQKQLNKLKRKRSNRNKRDGNGIWLDIFVSVLASSLILINLFGYVVPGWQDYALKDYVVYTGEYDEILQGRHRRTILADGTSLDGVAYSNKNYGTVIYSKRSKILITITE
jgi:hypothetical protein